MRRLLGRWGFRLAVLMSLAAWGVSYTVPFGVQRTRSGFTPQGLSVGSVRALVCSGGSVHLVTETWWPQLSPGQTPLPLTFRTEWAFCGRREVLDFPTTLGFGHSHWVQWLHLEGSETRQESVPLWVPCVLLALFGAVRRLRARYTSQSARGLYPRCGYDLRATSDRCPECGRPVAGRAAP